MNRLFQSFSVILYCVREKKTSIKGNKDDLNVLVVGTFLYLTND